MSIGWLLVPVGLSIAIGVSIFRRQASRREYLALFRASWGQPDPLRRRDLESIGALPALAGPLRIDDATWADLDLDALFQQLDRTLTEPGQQALHQWLRTPTDDVGALERRSCAMRALEQSAPLREDLQLRLVRLGSAPQGVFVRLLRTILPSLPLPAVAYRALALASFCTLGAFAYGAQYGFLLAAVAYALDAVAHYWALRHVTAALPGFVALQELLGAAQRLVEKPMPGLEPEQAAIRAQLEGVQEVAAAVATIGSARIGDEALAEYFDIFMLRQERLFCNAAPIVAVRAQALADLALRVGELDALQALASWRSGLSWCQPELGAGAAILARGVRHPLVVNCVPNDVRLSPAVLVTGSNMSGKSTYLRAVALNALLAQVTFTCLAEFWSGPPVRLMTCLRRADSVLAGRSAYLAEAQGVLDILKFAGAQPRLLCVLDEIFRGTNSLERVAAAAEVLRWLPAQGALVLAATHDHALTECAGFDNVHFTGRVSAQGIAFDHLLKPGPASTTNAIALLRFLGFPEGIVDAAEKARAAMTSRE